MKIITLIILISLISCSVTWETQTKTKVELQKKEKLDSIQQIKNNPKIPYGWSRYKK